MALCLKRSHELARIYEASQGGARQGGSCARFSGPAPEELRALMDRIEANGRGKPMSEQMLADAHRWDVENDRPNRLD